jgi:hypothetical protein
MSQEKTLTENAYIPVSQNCNSVDTVVPDKMRAETFKALATIDRRVNGVDEFVREKLKYNTLEELCQAFSAEQVDAIAVAIYNIEQKGQAAIIGDQTGIGKGRVAAGLIRYCVENKIIPIFLTEKPNLFSDIYRDLVAIGADDGIPTDILCSDDLSEDMKEEIGCPVTNKEDGEDGDYDAIEEEEEQEEESEEEGEEEIANKEIYKKNKEYPYFTYETTDDLGNVNIVRKKGKKFMKPFIVNGRTAKSRIKDINGNILYSGDNKLTKQVFGYKLKGSKELISGTAQMPSGFDVVIASYSQFSTPNPKRDFLRSIAQKSIFILDESHNASGDSNRGIFLREVVGESMGAMFLSGTFAKRPDNMPIYASKTAISEASLSDDKLIEAIQKGGVALQEIISSQLVSEGQMLRRQRTYEGISVIYRTLDKSENKVHEILNASYPHFDKEVEHKAIADRATEIIRDIIVFQEEYVNPAIKQLDKIEKAKYGKAEQRKGTSKAGVGNTPVFSGIFQVINQLLFSLKAESVAEIAIEWLKIGRKPVIAFSSTMESFFDKITNDDGTRVTIGDTIKNDFSLILKKRLDTVLKYTIKDNKGDAEYENLIVDEQSEEFQNEYYRILDKIQSASIGISCSPIDVVVEKIKKAGYTVGEVTGRKRFLQTVNGSEARIASRVVTPANDLFRQFNNNQIDVLLINQSGSTGASAHAIKTKRATMVKYDKSGNPIVPNTLEPVNEVKQRVMLVLQAELDINTEVQKRGRINRTGQIFKPIYEYVSSAIPAERRLMMMLQKKLKSLDANTASDQKQSTSILDTEDFLNKYGDELVIQWLRNNPLANRIIGDPLDINGKQDDDIVKSENAVHKVSGRVAILDSKMQDEFYSEMLINYANHVQYLDEIGEYDLEVKQLNLDAKTLDRKIAVAGRADGKSVFSRHTYLEKCEVNVLKKPFKKSELIPILEDALVIKNESGNQKVTAAEMQEYLKKKLKAYYSDKQEKDLQEIEESFTRDIQNIPNESRIKKIKEADQREMAIQERKEQLEEAKSEMINKTETKYFNLERNVSAQFAYFYVGKAIAYPTKIDDGSFVRGLFMGFDINDKAKNPFAPSAIKARFALTNSMKQISVPLSKSDVIMGVRGMTGQEIMGEREDVATLERWDELCKSSTSDRRTRYIVTGNILQGIGKDEYSNGRLISYSVIDDEGRKGTKKGILLAEEFNPDSAIKGGDGKGKQSTVTVPIGLAIKIIKGLVGGMVNSSDGMFSISRKGEDFMFIVSKKKGSATDAYVKNPTLDTFFTEGRLNFTSGSFTGTVPLVEIEDFVAYLGKHYRATVELLQSQFEQIQGDIHVEEEGLDVEDTAKSDEFLEKLKEQERLYEEELRRKEEEERLKREQEEQEALDRAKDLISEKELETRKMAVRRKLTKLVAILYKGR